MIGLWYDGGRCSSCIASRGILGLETGIALGGGGAADAESSSYFIVINLTTSAREVEYLARTDLATG